MAFSLAITRALFGVWGTNLTDPFSSPVQSREILREENRFYRLMKNQLVLRQFANFAIGRIQLGRSVFFAFFCHSDSFFDASFVYFPVVANSAGDGTFW